jgi:hypothetical protein
MILTCGFAPPEGMAGQISLKSSGRATNQEDQDGPGV